MGNKYFTSYTRKFVEKRLAVDYSDFLETNRMEDNELRDFITIKTLLSFVQANIDIPHGSNEKIKAGKNNADNLNDIQTRRGRN